MNISANMNEIRMASGRLKQKSASYEQLIHQIYAHLHAMDGIWQGSDSAAFISQIDTFKPALLEMKAIQDQYAMMLDQSASAYESLQNQRASLARSL